MLIFGKGCSPLKHVLINVQKNALKSYYFVLLRGIQINNFLIFVDTLINFDYENIVFFRNSSHHPPIRGILVKCENRWNILFLIYDFKKIMFMFCSLYLIKIVRNLFIANFLTPLKVR